MNVELISSLARSHRNELLNQASRERAAYDLGRRRSVRRRLAQALCALGDVFYVLGTALIPNAE